MVGAVKKYPAVPAVGKASRLTLRSFVVDNLRDSLGDGTLTPGTHLAEVELSAQLGVSRATLREALRELQQEGLLTQDARGRVTVRILSLEDIRGLFDVRLALESLGVTRLCGLAGGSGREAVVAELEAAIDVIAESHDPAQALSADLAFHELLCSLTGNDMLVQSWRSLRGLIRLVMSDSGVTPERADSSRERHARIVEGIRQGDATLTVARLSEHMESAVAYVLEHRQDIAEVGNAH